MKQRQWKRWTAALSAAAILLTPMATQAQSPDQETTQINHALTGTATANDTETSDKPEASQNPEATDKPQSTDKPQATEKPENVPQTGDEAMVQIWVALALVSTAALALAVTKKKHNV